MHETKQRLILAGLEMMLERGYRAVGIQDLLTATSLPKGSFYHHVVSKEDLALQSVDAALRSRLTRDSHPFDAVLNFYFAAMTTR